MTTDTVPGSATPAFPQLHLADAVEQVLDELAIVGDEVRHHSPWQGLEAEDEEQDREDRGLEVRSPRDLTLRPEPGVAQPQGHAPREEESAREHEDLERLVHRVDAQDGRGRALDVVPGGADEARWTRLPRRDGEVSHRHPLLARLD